MSVDLEIPYVRNALDVIFKSSVNTEELDLSFW